MIFCRKGGRADRPGSSGGVNNGGACEGNESKITPTRKKKSKHKRDKSSRVLDRKWKRPEERKKKKKKEIEGEGVVSIISHEMK